MRRSRIAIVTFIAAALVALVIVIVKYGPLASDPSATPAGGVDTATPSVVASGHPTSTASAAPSTAQSAPASPAASVSPSATATSPASAPSATASRRSVDVVITYVDWSGADGVVEAGAYATVVEDPGTCTLKLTSGGHSATGSIAALTDASTMSCGGLTVPRDRLSSGTWTAVVTYESTGSVGASAPVEVVVP